MKFVIIPPAVRGLIDARMKIVTGWCQGSEALGGKKHCAMTAFNGSDRSDWVPALDYLHQALPDEWRQKPYISNTLKFVRFNDDPTTTKQDVLDWFDRAIAFAALELETVDVRVAIV